MHYCRVLSFAHASLQSEAYGVSINQTSYLVSVNVLWLALGPIIWAPLCDTYGRRPVYLVAMLITLVSSIACAVAKSYGVQIFTRMLQGFGASGAIAVGAGSIADVFFLHERGVYNGIWIATSQSGPFISPMILGVVIENLGWRWSLWVMAIFAAGFLVLMFCLLPETLYVRHLDADAIERNTVMGDKRKRLFAQTTFGRISPKPISFLEFFRPLYMLKYPSVGLVALSWCVGVALPDIGISNIVPLAFGGVYGWGPSAQGLSNAGFLVGCAIGELFAGKVSDVVSMIITISTR
jgi:multidrug resistance protein